MSHFVVLVVGDDVDGQLEAYDENTDVEPYLDSIEDQVQPAIDAARQFVIERTESDTTGWGDQQFLDAYYGDGYWTPNADGTSFEHWSRYNPKSKWDWYVTGGRWDGFIKTKTGKEVNEATLAKIDLSTLEIPFALVKNGQWYEKGRMGWWAMVADEKKADHWEAEVRAALTDLPGETLLTVVDCHI